MNHLLDTHTLIWFINGDAQLEAVISDQFHSSFNVVVGFVNEALTV